MTDPTVSNVRVTSPRECRTSEGHVAVRFGDAVNTTLWETLDAFLDGRNVSRDCYEANVDEGWVLLRGSRSDPEPVKVYGAVRLEGIIRS